MCILFLVFRLRYPSEQTLTFEPIIKANTPVNVVIDQQSGHLYWTDYTTSGNIGRCNIDGTNAITILNETHPWGLAIDLKSRFVYYCLLKDYNFYNYVT